MPLAEMIRIGPVTILIGDALHALRCREALLGRVERQCRSVCRGAAPIVISGLLLLEMTGVRQQDLRQVGGRRSGRDGATKSILDEPRQIPRVIDVPVREHDPVH